MPMVQSEPEICSMKGVEDSGLVFEKNAEWFRRRDGHLLTIHETDFSVYSCQGHRLVSWSSRNRLQQAKRLCLQTEISLGVCIFSVWRR